MTAATSNSKREEQPSIEDVLALSPLQAGLFSLAKLAGDEADLYAVQLIVDIEGPLDADLLRRSAQAVLDRHPNLRASFWDRDLPKPVQIVPSWAELPWQERDVRAEELEAVAEEDRVRPFDLERGPALRVLLLTLPEGSRRMILTVHHILMDGWAMAVFYREILAAYAAGGDTGALPPARPYRDYIGWLESRDHAQGLSVWREHLAGASPLLLAEFSSDGSPPARVPEKFTVFLDEQETGRLVEWARTHGMTLSTITQYAWAVLLSRLTDRRDVVFGVVVAGRPASLAGVESMVGLFINTTPSRVRLDPALSVLEQCAQLQRDAAKLRDIDYLSLSETQRASGHSTLFDTLFVYENAPVGDATETAELPGGVRLRPFGLETLTHYPLTVVPLLFQGRLAVTIETLPGALPVEAGELGERLLSLVRQLPARSGGSPDDLDALLPGERERILAASASPVLPASAQKGVAEALWAQADKTPDAMALSWSGGSWTYRELTDKAARLAGALAARGVGPESVVALRLPRSPEFVAAIFAVLAAGGAYVPLDPALPQARIDSILRQAEPSLVLGEQDLVFNGPSAGPVPVHPDQAAYVIFTSGSTGEPKGVIGTHRALLSYAHDHWERMLRPAQERLGRPLRIAHAWSLSFDASWQPLAGLLGGHATHLFDEEEMRDAQRLVDGIAELGLDMIDTSPSMLSQLDVPALAVLALGGEALSSAQWERLAELPATAHNCYGPTETTVEALVAAVAEHPDPVIGRPTEGMAAYVLDSELRPVPNGVVGELYISGEQLTRGYAANTGRTAERYVADPFRPGQRMYRTGDLARRLASGAVQCLGRADEQVKIRGHRIELGEVEAALLALPRVRAAAVAAVPRGSSRALAACVVPQEGAVVDPQRLRAALAERLPGYMIPARVVVLGQLPLTANGKLDTAVFAKLDEEAGAEPSTPTEHLLAGLLAEQIGARQIFVDQDFFELGMDSISAIALVSKARRSGVSLTPRMIMRAGTIRALAAEAESAVAARAVADPEDAAAGPSPVMGWLFEYDSYRRFAQAQLIRVPEGITEQQVRGLLGLMLDSHPMLRAKLEDDGALVPSAARDVLAVAPSGAAMEEQARLAYNRLDPCSGSMVAAVLFPSEGRLFLAIHHLVVDIVSWQILLAELAHWWQQLVEGETPEPAREFTGYRRWCKLLSERAQSDDVAAQEDFWRAQLNGPDPMLGARRLCPEQDRARDLRSATHMATAQTTERLLRRATGRIGVRELVMAALAAAVAGWRERRGEDSPPALVMLESHGRADETIGDGADTTGTVGWFTSMFPLRIGSGSPDAPAQLDVIADQLAAVPDEGLGFGLARYLRTDTALGSLPEPQIILEYLGRFDFPAGEGNWQSVFEPLSADSDLIVPEPDLPVRFELELIVAMVDLGGGSQVYSTWRWHKDIFTEDQIAELQEMWERSLERHA